jgi:xanthine/uracil/vitamin C permease (AzgA family)
MRHRIPFKMFFDWFVPYSSIGNKMMAVVLPAGCVLVLRPVLPEIVLIPYGALFSVYLLSYHHKAASGSVFATAAGMGLLIALGERRVEGASLVGILVLASLGALLGFFFQRGWRMKREVESRRRFLVS